MDSLVAPIHVPRGRRRPPRGFTMAELLVAVLLLSLSVGAMTRMWSLSRNVTGQSQNIGEAYSVARQEIERDKGLGFNTIFISAGIAKRVTDYDQNGTPLVSCPLDSLNNVLSGTKLTVLGITVATTLLPASPPSHNAYYRAISTYASVDTGAETDAASALGVQIVKIWRVNGSIVDTTQPPVYQTSGFYSTAGI